MDLKTTGQVVQTLQITHSNLRVLLERYPNLKPVLYRPEVGYLWSAVEIERIKTHRATHQRGRPKRKSGP